MEIRDRGSIKWVSLMLPEHAAKLKEIFVEKKEKPLLDEQKIAEIDALLKESLTEKKELQLTYYKDGDFHIVQGIVTDVDRYKRTVLLSRRVNEAIPLSDIIDAELINHS